MADDIAQWLEGLGLGQYATAIADNGVDFDILPRLSDDELKELGFGLGDRHRLKAAIEALDGDSSVETAAVERPHETTPPEAERRQLTVMFCDLVGSTALSARLDPEDMRDVIRSYQDACAGVVTRYEGFVAKYMGDGVLVYFGYPTAHEDDAERALNAGLGIVEAVGDLEGDLQVRIGIATGMVVVGDIVGEGVSREAAIIGETPNLAARLQEIAGPNTVVIAETTHGLGKPVRCHSRRTPDGIDRARRGDGNSSPALAASQRGRWSDCFDLGRTGDRQVTIGSGASGSHRC